MLRPLKPHEALIFFVALSALWECLFSTWFDAVPDLIALQYPVKAATMLQLLKWLEIDGLSSTSGFLNKRISGSSAPEICFVAVVTVLTGIGAWAVLVLVEAKFMGANSAYQGWGLINAEQFRAIRWSRSWVVVDLIAAAFMVPIYEEIAFRGLLLGILLKKYSPVKAILVGSVIFGVFHLHRSFLGSFFHAILFSILAIRLSSLYASMIAHGIFNLCVEGLRFTAGMSMVADMAQIDKMFYWRFEFLLLVIGLLLGLTYVYLSLKTVSNPVSNFLLATKLQTSSGDTE
jgi:membrane protease YdiL (CAAX protease family)